MQIALHSDTTGKRLTSVSGVSCFNAWQCLQAAIAADHDVPVDAVCITEDDDGVEVVSLDGIRLGFVVTEISGHTFGNPANRNDDPAQEAVREVLAAAE
jgi:hypothetical protein